MPTGHQHGRIEAFLTGLLFVYLMQHKIGHLLTGETGIYTRRNPDTVRGIDVAFISNGRYDQIQSTNYLDIAPELIIEILSPNDSWSDVHQKLAEYFTVGVLLVWVVDPRLEQIHAFRSLDDITLLTRDDELTAHDILPGFSALVADIFRNQP
jgi:Uma2 family endonuclease